MNGTAGKPLRFTTLYLENWRNFSKVDVALQRRVVLIGPNASGKSNLLDFFRFLHDIVAVGGGFQEAVRKRDGVSRLRCLAARRHPELVLRVQLGNEEDDQAWEYELHFTQDNLRRPVIKRERALCAGKILFDRPDHEDNRDAERLTQTYLEQVNMNKELREVVDFFASVRYLHIVPQLVRDPDRSVGRRNDPYGGDFLEQIARTPEKTQHSRLRRITDALKVAVPQLQEIELSRDARGTPHVRGNYEHWRPQGAWQSEEQFSDGTLRLMGLLWALLDGAGPLLLEEPEQSLHPEVVRFIPQMFARIQRKSGRQAIISTHSLDLLRDPGIGLDELLILQPRGEGTDARTAANKLEIHRLLEAGMGLGEAVMPYTRPERADQLPLFGD